MDMNRNEMHGAVSNQDNNGQYVQVSTTQSRTPVVPQNTYSQAGQHLSRDVIIKQLLNAKSTEDLLKVQKAALARSSKRATQLKQANQPSQWKPIACKPNPKIDPTSSFQNGLNNQTPVMSSYRMVSSTNSAPQTTQQSQSVPVMQWYTATGYSDRGGQQPMQNTQANVSHVFPHQNVAQPVLSGYSSVRHPVQTPYQRQTSATNSQPVYTFQNGNPGPCLGASTETNFPVSSQDYRTSQNDHTPTATNYVTLQTQPYVNIISPLQQQTAPQWNGNYVQTHTPLANNPMLLVIDETPAMPPQPLSYTQSTTNPQSIQQGSVNQQYANQSQNYAAENVQQPHHSAAGQQEKSLAAPVSQTQMDESQNHRSHQRLFTLCQVLKKRYMLLSQENEFLKEKLRDYKNSQDNVNACVGSAPLVSTLQNGPVLTNNVVAGQLSMPQNGPVLNPLELHSAHGFQGLNVYNTNGINVPAQSNSQTGQSFHGNVFSNQVPASNRNVLEQNSSVIDGNQMDAGHIAGSTAQGQPENLRGNIHQNMPAETATLHADNQRISGGNPHNGSWSQNGLHVNTLQSPAQSNFQTGQSFHGNVFSNQVSASNRNVLEQNNSVIDGNQMDAGRVAGSTAQGQTENLRGNIHQNVPAGTAILHPDNQRISSGNPHNGNWSQNGFRVNPLQSLDPSNPVTSESLEEVVPSDVRSDCSSSYKAMFNTKSNFPSGSREAIEAALPLWTSVPQSSSLNKDGPTENEPSLLDAYNLLKEITLPSTNEATPAVSAHKPDLTAPNASKCVEPQIAVVSPLLQCKEMAQKENMLPKGQAKDNMSMNVKENDSFNKILQALESLSTPVKEPEDVAPSPSDIEVSSQKAADPNSAEDIEMADNDFQISGICTLVEGSAYNSSIEMFEESVKTECDTASDVGNNHTIQDSDQENMTCTSEYENSTLSNTAMVALDVQPAESEEAGFSTSEENLDGTSVHCFGIQNDQSVLSPSEDFGDLEGSSVSDQLSELLSAFPYGIKNYMSENKLDNRERRGKLSESVTFSDSQSACNIDQLTQDKTPTGPELFKVTNSIKAESLLEPNDESVTFNDSQSACNIDQLTQDKTPIGPELKLTNSIKAESLLEPNDESVTFSGSQSACCVDQLNQDLTPTGPQLFKLTNSIKTESLLKPNDESVTFSGSQSACCVDQLNQDLTPTGPELFKLTNSIKTESLLGTNDESVTFSGSQSACNIDQLNQDITPTGPELFKLANGIGAESLLKSTTGHQAAVDPIPTETVESSMDWILMQFPEDDFEIVCNNPENNIEITLIPQDEITKMFPNELPLTPNCQETEADTGPEATSTEESQDSHVNVELNPLEKGDLMVNEAPDKDLFCCLVSRLNHTNRNAPKCNCKLSEFHTSGQSPIKSSIDDVTNKTLENLPEISSPNFCKSAGYELKDPEILPLKVTKFEPIKCSSESKKSTQNFRRSQQEEAKQKSVFSTSQVLEVDLGENKTLTLEKSLGSSSQTKKHYPNKMELNVIPQKNKQLHKGKKKDREQKTPRDTHGVVDTRSDNKRALHKNSGRKVLKTPNEEKTSSLKTRSPFTSKHIDRSLNKPKPSPGLVKATPSIAKPKHYERSKKRSESHFEKTRKVITVQEYLQRKRELCNKSNETKIKQSDETERRHTLDEKSTLSQIGSNLLNKHKRPLSPAKIHLTSKTKKHTSETLKEVIRTLRDWQSPGPCESSRKKSRNLDNCHGKETEVKNAKGSERSSSRDKICFVADPRYQKHKGCRVQQYAN